jgi:heme exporter protein D
VRGHHVYNPQVRDVALLPPLPPLMPLPPLPSAPIVWRRIFFSYTTVAVAVMHAIHDPTNKQGIRREFVRKKRRRKKQNKKSVLPPTHPHS